MSIISTIYTYLPYKMVFSGDRVTRTHGSNKFLLDLAKKWAPDSLRSKAVPLEASIANGWRMATGLAAMIPVSISTMAIIRPMTEGSGGCQTSTEMRQGRGKETHSEGRLQWRRQGIP